MKTRIMDNFSRKNIFAGLLASALVLAGLVYFNFYAAAVDASGITDSVIVEFKADPGAVWKAKLEKSGGKVSDEQLQQYRASVTAEQDSFLEELKSRGVQFYESKASTSRTSPEASADAPTTASTSC